MQSGQVNTGGLLVTGGGGESEGGLQAPAWGPDARVEEGGGRRTSYLWGSEEGRRGFREDSYEAIGTHKIGHFQLHRDGQN